MSINLIGILGLHARVLFVEYLGVLLTIGRNRDLNAACIKYPVALLYASIERYFADLHCFLQVNDSFEVVTSKSEPATCTVVVVAL